MHNFNASPLLWCNNILEGQAVINTPHLTIIHRLSICLFPGTTKTAEPIATIFSVCNPGPPWSKIGINIITWPPLTAPVGSACFSLAKLSDGKKYVNFFQTAHKHSFVHSCTAPHLQDVPHPTMHGKGSAPHATHMNVRMDTVPCGEGNPIGLKD